MDLGLAGKTAIVCASSRGLGKACALQLAREGVSVVMNGRDAAVLEQSAAELRSLTGGKVIAVCADLTAEEGRAALLRAAPHPDILVNNGGGPPAGDFRGLSRADWLKALDANMLVAIDLIRATVDGMIERRFGRIVNITSVAVKAPISYLALSNGARSGLTGFVAGLAREVSKHNVTINNLLPGTFDTRRVRDIARTIAVKAGRTLAEQMELDKQSEASLRLGVPAELGAACAFLCSVHAGYIVGQNLLLDGGTYPGTF